MALEDQQKKWLLAALKGKGRLKSFGINKQFANYQGRRKKVADIFDTLPTTHSNYLHIKIGLQEADKKAQAGDFKGAYKDLDTIKALARATDAGTSGKILEHEIIQLVRNLENTLEVHIEEVDKFYADIDAALIPFQNLVACSTKGDLSEAVQHRKTILAQEPNLHGPLDGLRQAYPAMQKRFENRDVKNRSKAIRKELDRLRDSGFGDIADTYVGRLDTVENTHDSKDKIYVFPARALNRLDEISVQAENRLTEVKSVAAFSQGEQDYDDKTTALQSKLTPVPAKDVLKQLMREEARMKQMRQEYLADVRRDQDALSQTGSVDLELTPEPAPFMAADITDDLDIDLDGDLTPDERAVYAKAAGQKMSDMLKSAETPQSVLLDLMTKTEDNLLMDLFHVLFPTTANNGLMQEELDLLKEMAKEMFNKINEDAPNKVDPTGATVSVGGVEYKKLKTLKSGGLGTANLFESPDGKKMVMKTPNAGNEEAYADLLKEMRIMARLQEGAEGSDTASAIPELYGAARGEDGSMHMLMEFIDGGDLSDVSKSMNALASSGLLPPAARTAMQADLVGKTATALSELQRQGLVHHDLKALNVMMTSEGQVKIIDYGESGFVGEDGYVSRADTGLGTPGYGAQEGLTDQQTTQSDSFALGTMLLDMVGQVAVDKRNKLELESGALGRLIQSLHETDDKRVSLEGLAQSAFMTSATRDYGDEAMTELRSAATEFGQASKSVKSEKSYDDMIAPLSALRFSDNQPVFEFRFKEKMDNGKSLGLDDAQGFMKEMEDKKTDIMRGLQSNPGRLTEEELNAIPEEKRQAAKQKAEQKWLLEQRKLLADLSKAKAYLQTSVIDDMLDTALDASKAAYEKELKSPMTSVICSINGQIRSMTLPQATAAQDELAKIIADTRAEALLLLSDDDLTETEMQEKLDAANKILLERDAEMKTLEGQIEAAAGPEAKLFFSKKRLDKATAPFGPSTARRGPAEVEEDDDTPDLIAQIDKLLTTLELDLKAAEIL